MDRKKMIWIGVFVGGFAGGYVPTLFGASAFSLWSVFLSAMGSVAGIWLGFKLSS